MPGAELLRLLAGHPEIEVVHVTADSNAGAAVGDLYPSLLARLRAPPVLAARRRRPRGPRPRVLRAAARCQPGAAARPARPRRPRDRSRRRLPAPARRVLALVRRAARGAARSPTASRTGWSSCTATRSRRIARRVARLLPDGGEPRVRAARCARPRRAAHRRRRGLGRLGRGPRPQDHQPVLGGERERRGVRAADASPHRGDGTGADARSRGSRVQVLFTPHLVPMTRGILATCYARPATDGLCRRRGCSSTTASSTRTIRASSWSTSRRARRRRTAPNVAHVTVRFDARTETVVAIAAEDNLVKGASGQMIQAANLLLGLPETTGLPLLGYPAMSVTAAKGFVAGGIACGIKESGAPDLALVATDDHVPVPAAAVFTSNLAQAAPVQVSRAHLADGHAAAVVLSSGNANAATGESGRRDARRMCALTAEGIDVGRRPTCSCARPASSASRCRWPRSNRASPKLCGDAQPRRRARCGAGDAHDRHGPQGGDRARPGAAIVGGMAKGAAMLSPAMATMLAVLTTDAAADPQILQQALAQRGERDVRLPERRRLPVHERHRDGARQRPGGGGRTVCSSPTRSTSVCGSLAEQMARDAEGATKFVRVRVRRRAHAGRSADRGRARWPTASSCSARSTAATPTGGGCSRSSAPAARSSIPSSSTSPTTA